MPRLRDVSPEERSFLEAYDPAAFDRPSVAVDVVVLAVWDGEARVVLVRRNEHPDLGAWALPGTFVGIREPLEAAVHRVLRDKAGLALDHLEQLYTFGEPGRDPRGRVISVAWLAVVRPERVSSLPEGVRVATVRVPWEGEAGGPVGVVDDDGAELPLAFDHDLVLGTAVQRIRGKLAWTGIGFHFLPERFTLLQLRQVWETLLSRPLNKDSFRKTVLANHDLVDTGEKQGDVGHRPAALYRRR